MDANGCILCTLLRPGENTLEGVCVCVCVFFPIQSFLLYQWTMFSYYWLRKGVSLTWFIHERVNWIVGAVKVALIIVYYFNRADNPQTQWKLDGESVWFKT